MKKGPILAGVAVAVVAIVAVAVFFLVSNLDSLVKGAIEKYGSQVLGTRVRVSSVKIELTEGRGSIRGLTVANPEGFSSEDAFRLGEITVKIDLSSVTQSPIVVPEVRIISPEVRWEQVETRSNIQVLLHNVNSSGSSSGSEGGGDAGGGGEPTRIALANFVFEKGHVEGDLQVIGKQAHFQAVLPPVHVRNIGGSRGATPTQIGQQVMTAFLASVTKSVGKAVASSQAERLIDDRLGGEAGEAAKGLLRRLGGD